MEDMVSIRCRQRKNCGKQSRYVGLIKPLIEGYSPLSVMEELSSSSQYRTEVKVPQLDSTLWYGPLQADLLFLVKAPICIVYTEKAI